MKRSEIVLNVIRPIIEKHLVNVVCPENVESYMAFDIIEAIEKAGMAPPERYRNHDWHERGITYSEWIQEPSKVRVWEDETWNY